MDKLKNFCGKILKFGKGIHDVYKNTLFMMMGSDGKAP